MPSVTKYPLLLLAVLWLLTVGAFGGGYHWQTRSADAIRAEAAQAHETKQWKMTLVGDYFNLLELFAAWEGHPHATEITLMKMAPLGPSVCRAEILVRQTAPVKNSH